MYGTTADTLYVVQEPWLNEQITIHSGRDLIIRVSSDFVCLSVIVSFWLYRTVLYYMWLVLYVVLCLSLHICCVLSRFTAYGMICWCFLCCWFSCEVYVLYLELCCWCSILMCVMFVAGVFVDWVRCVCNLLCVSICVCVCEYRYAWSLRIWVCSIWSPECVHSNVKASFYSSGPLFLFRLALLPSVFGLRSSVFGLQS